MTQPIVVLAGATGDQGRRTALALALAGAEVRALVRAGSAAQAQEALRVAGATVVTLDLNDVEAVTASCRGARSVVSTLGGLHDVIVDRQTVLLDAAVRAGVPRFISSDYSADYTKTAAGANRNFDLRREFMARADQAPIAVTSIFNGAFLDMLGAEMPIIQPRIRRILYWSDRGQILDFTSRNDVAAYTAQVAIDENPVPRILRVSGASVTVEDIAATMAEITGRPYRTLRVGGLGLLGVMIRATRLIALQRDAVFPAWQGMQYMRDQFAGLVRLTPTRQRPLSRPDLDTPALQARRALQHLALRGGAGDNDRHHETTKERADSTRGRR